MKTSGKTLVIFLIMVTMAAGSFMPLNGKQDATFIYAEGSESPSKVVHITWDGFYNELYELAKTKGIATPNLDSLVHSGMRLANHSTTVPSVEAAKYSTMTGAFPKTTGNTYKYFDGNEVKGLENSVNLAQTITQAMQNLKKAVVIDEAAVSGEAADTYIYFTSTKKFADSAAIAVQQLADAGQPDYLNIYANDLYMLKRNTPITDRETYLNELLATLVQLDSHLGSLLSAVNQYGEPMNTVYILSSHSGDAVTETKKITDIHSALTSGGFTFKEVSAGNAAGPHELVLIKNYEAKYLQLRYNMLDAERENELVALLKNESYVEEVLVRSDLDLLGVHPMFADIIIIPKSGYSFCPASVGVSRPDSFEDSARFIFGVIAGAPIQALNKTGRVSVETSIADLAPTIASLLNIPAPIHAEGKNLLALETEDRYVLYVNWDGFAYDWYELANSVEHAGTPTINGLLQNGVLFRNARTGVPSITGPMMQAVASGAWPADTGNSYRYYDQELNRVIQYGRENILENIAEAAAKRGITIVGVNAWFFEERGLFAGNLSQPYIEAAGLGGFTQRVDEMIKVIKGEPVQTGGKTVTFAEVPKFLSIYGDEIDGAGHNEENVRDVSIVSHSREELMRSMASTVIHMDRELGRLVQALKDRGIYEKTTIFLTADHGMSLLGADDEASAAASPPALSSLPELEAVIANAGYAYRGEPFKVETVFQEGRGAKADTEIVITTVGLQAQIKFLIPLEKVAVHQIIEDVMEKEFYGAHLFQEELIKRGAPAHFADLLISPKPPYNFKTGDPNRVRVIRGQHDSLDESSQHIFTMISGEAVQKGIVYENQIHNIDIAPTIARVLGFDGPAGATGTVLDDILIDSLKGPALTIDEPLSADFTVFESSIDIAGQTEARATVKINRIAVGKADEAGRFSVTQALVPGINRVIIEAEAAGKQTRKVLFITSLTPRQALTDRIAEAIRLVEEAIEGEAVGQYKPGSKAILQQSIREAVIVEENIQAASGQIDEALSALESAIAAFQLGKRTGAVHLFGEIILNGADKEDVKVVLSNADNSEAYTAVYGDMSGQTAMGRKGVMDVVDAYNNPVDGRLQYYFDVPQGAYTISMSSGTKAAAKEITAETGTTGQLPWGTYTVVKAKDISLRDVLPGSDEKPYVITGGQLSRQNGIKASVIVAPTVNQSAGKVVIVFQLWKGKKPTGIIAVEKEINQQEKVTAHFNTNGSNYKVKVYVVDSYSGSLTNVGRNLAEPVTLE